MHMGANNNALQGRWLSEGNSNSGAIVSDDIGYLESV